MTHGQIAGRSVTAQSNKSQQETEQNKTKPSLRVVVWTETKERRFFGIVDEAKCSASLDLVSAYVCILSANSVGQPSARGHAHTGACTRKNTHTY